jgi:hypothetical protein
MKDKIKIRASLRDHAGNYFSIVGAYFKKSVGRSDWYSCAICCKDLAKKEIKYVYSCWHICEKCALEHEAKPIDTASEIMARDDYKLIDTASGRQDKFA